jgi:hypothetical protein
MQTKGRIISTCGLIGSGKSTVADILIEQHNFVKVSWADSLKDAVSVIFGWDRALLEGDTVESRAWREQVDPWWAARLDMPDLTPRRVFQTWGTEVCRDYFHSDIWVASLEKKLTDTTKNYVIPDTRFLNEIDSARNMGGEMWRVRRGPDPQWFDQYIYYNIQPQGIHPSEWQWARCNFDQTIENTGTIDDLKEKVALMLH